MLLAEARGGKVGTWLIYESDSEVEDSERRQWVKVCFMKQCKDAHLQPGSRGSGVVPSDELST